MSKQTTDQPLPSATQPIEHTFSALLKKSGYKHEFFYEKLGMSRPTWLRKRNNLEQWTIAEIRPLATLLCLTPQELFQAIYLEAIGEPTDRIPPQKQSK